MPERPRRTRRRATDGILTRNVVPGIHQLEHAHVNCYILESREGVTIVDAAFPDTWGLMLRALSAIGRRPAEVAAMVLTHSHFDHLGFASRVIREWDIPVYCHPLEAYVAKHPYRYLHERARSVYPLVHPRSIPVLSAMTAAGALRVPGIDSLRFFADGETVDVPGHPRVVYTPGHTVGHSSLFLPEISTVISGDALVTFDPYTGHVGPQIVSGAATADSRRALRSLDALTETRADIVLPGHGQPWRRGVGAAVREAMGRGPS